MEISFVGFGANFLAIIGGVYLIVLSLSTALIVAGLFGALMASFMDEEFLNDAGIYRPEFRLKNETHLDGFAELCEGTLDLYNKILDFYKEENEF